MRIAAHLGVKDEIELIEAALAHLARIGVDQIIVCDMSSTDGTERVLARHEGRAFEVIRLSDTEPDDFAGWASANLEKIRNVDADWIVFLDADEFWLPASGSLKRLAGLDACDLLAVDRYNVPLAAEGALLPEPPEPSRYADALLIVEPVPAFREVLQQSEDEAWIRAVPMGKVMVRPSCVGALTIGMHDVVPPPGRALRRAKADDVVIAHLPFTTRARFKAKVENIRKVFDVHDAFFADRMAWHWRRWVELARAGKIDAEFDRAIYAPAKIAELRGAGVIRSAAELFAARGIAPLTDHGSRLARP